MWSATSSAAVVWGGAVIRGMVSSDSDVGSEFRGEGLEGAGFKGAEFKGDLNCARSVCSGDLIKGRAPQTKKELSCVVTRLASSLHVTLYMRKATNNYDIIIGGCGLTVGLPVSPLTFMGVVAVRRSPEHN